MIEPFYPIEKSVRLKNIDWLYEKSYSKKHNDAFLAMKINNRFYWLGMLHLFAHCGVLILQEKRYEWRVLLPTGRECDTDYSADLCRYLDYELSKVQ